MEDALSATRAAVEEGIVPGGGVALLNALEALADVDIPEGDAATGVKILHKALLAPMRILAQNAGYKGEVVIETVRKVQGERNDHQVGFNVLTGDYINMVDAGIIDPAKVTRGALENAASIAIMILSTEALVTDKPKASKNGRGPAMPNMDDMDY